jgi:hypothetical protein
VQIYHVLHTYLSSPRNSSATFKAIVSSPIFFLEESILIFPTFFYEPIPFSLSPTQEFKL